MSDDSINVLIQLLSNRCFLFLTPLAAKLWKQIEQRLL